MVALHRADLNGKLLICKQHKPATLFQAFVPLLFVYTGTIKCHVLWVCVPTTCRTNSAHSSNPSREYIDFKLFVFTVSNLMRYYVFLMTHMRHDFTYVHVCTCSSNSSCLSFPCEQTIRQLLACNTNIMGWYELEKPHL